VGVSESPATVSILSQASKVSGFFDTMPSLIYLDLAPRRCDDREFSSERINAQIVAPCQVDTVDGPRKILSALLCGGCVRER
jgi:hypothetical protein